MTIFEYFLILFSVMLSLGLTQLATGIGELARAKGKVRWSFTHAMWIVFIAGAIIDIWASVWLMREARRFDLVGILLALLTAMSTYLAALWVIPRPKDDQPVDLFAFVIAERRHFCGALLAFIFGGVSVNLYLLPGHFNIANYFIAAPMALSIGLAWWNSDPRLQRAAAIAAVMLMTIYFGIYFPSIA